MFCNILSSIHTTTNLFNSLDSNRVFVNLFKINILYDLLATNIFVTAIIIIIYFIHRFQISIKFNKHIISWYNNTN